MEDGRLTRQKQYDERCKDEPTEGKLAAYISGTCIKWRQRVGTTTQYTTLNSISRRHRSIIL